MHATNCRSVAVQRVQTRAGLRIPHLQRPVRASADDRVALHLRRPDPSSVADQRPQALFDKISVNIFARGLQSMK